MAPVLERIECNNAGPTVHERRSPSFRAGSRLFQRDGRTADLHGRFGAVGYGGGSPRLPRRRRRDRGRSGIVIGDDRRRQGNATGGEIEGADRCGAIEPAIDGNRAHKNSIVELDADESASAVVTRDSFGKVKLWNASSLTLELAADISAKQSELRACSYLLKRSAAQALTGKIVLLNRTEASEFDLSDQRFSTLVSDRSTLNRAADRTDELQQVSAASSIHFIDDRLVIAVMGRTLKYYDLAENRIRLSIPVPGTDKELSVGVSRDRQWLATLDSDGVQLWSIFRGVRYWTFADPERAPAGGQPRPGQAGGAAIGFLSDDRYVICAVSAHSISIHDRRTGELIVRRTLAPEAKQSITASARVNEISNREADEGLKVLWDAGFAPSLWNLRKLERRCTFNLGSNQRSTGRKQFAILPGLKRAFAVSGTNHVAALNLEQPGFIGYLKDPELPPPPPATTYNPPSTTYSPGGTYTICTCNKVCTCIPVRRCQAHELLHRDAQVRAMAEELLLSIGAAAFDYLKWAAETADAELAARITGLMASIAAGRRSDPGRWPTAAACSARLACSPVIATMSAQWIKKLGGVIPPPLDARVAFLLRDAPNHSWQILARAGYRATRRRPDRARAAHGR
jgi:hypothetical protein